MDLPFAVTTPMRSADTNSRPRFTLPAGTCDSHFHVFEAGYPHVPDPQYTFPEGTLDQYLRDDQGAWHRAHGDRAAHVLRRRQLAHPRHPGRLGDRARAVVRLPEDADSATLDDYDRAGVRAIRLDLFARRSAVDGDPGLHRAHGGARTSLGWHLQFYAPGSVIRDLLPFLADLEVRFVIDHMGYMKKSDGLGDEDFTRLLGLLGSGKCWIKLTGPYRVAGDEPISSVASLGRALVAARADRLLWGTDWPHLPDGQRDTGELLALLADWAPDAADRDRILVDSPDLLFFGHSEELMALLTEIQRIPTTGARAVCAFALAGEHWLAIPQLAADAAGSPPGINGGSSDTEVLLLRDTPNGFVPAGTLPVGGGEDAEAFELDGRSFLAVASIRSGSGPYDFATVSPIFVSEGGAFVPFQSVESFAAKQWRFFRAGGSAFLGLAQNLPSGDRSSLVLRWDGTRFAPFQEIESKAGYNFAAFDIDGDTYLAHADHVLPARLYRFDGDRFVEHQSLLPAGGRAFQLIEDGAVRYLAVARIDGDSVLLRWNGTEFVPHDTLPGGPGGREFAWVETPRGRYLVRVDFIHGTPPNRSRTFAPTSTAMKAGASDGRAIPHHRRHRRHRAPRRRNPPRGLERPVRGTGTGEYLRCRDGRLRIR